MPGDRDETASARWRRLVHARLGEMERLSPGAGLIGGQFWDRRAERFAANVKVDEASDDPLLRRLRRATDRSSTVIDAGAGTGRLALPLAPAVRHVTAVDPSGGMLAILRREAGRLGVANVTALEARWEEADIEPADVVFSSFVLSVLPEPRPFLAKLEATARASVFLYLGAYTGDAVLDPLWRHFHGEPRAPGPSYIDALAVLRELGIAPHVSVVELPNRRRFATIDEAVEYYRDALVLQKTADIERELADLLQIWLLGRRGSYRSPLRSAPAAIFHWRPR